MQDRGVEKVTILFANPIDETTQIIFHTHMATGHSPREVSPALFCALEAEPLLHMRVNTNGYMTK